MRRTGIVVVMLALCVITLSGCRRPSDSSEMRAGARTAASAAAKASTSARLGIVLTENDPETVFNVFRLANYALNQRDEVSVFLLGKGVDLDRIRDAKFNVREQAENFLQSGGKIMACGTCLKMRNSEGSALCPVSTLQDLYELVKASDRVLTF